MLRNHLSLAVLASCFVLIAGCSGEATAPAGATPASPTSAPALSISTLTAFSATVGTPSSQTLTLTNTGAATLTLTSVALGGTNPTAFAIVNNCGTSLAANATCTVTLTFTPPSAGSFSATVTLTDNATGSPQAVTLTGAGTSATAAITRLFYAFPEADNSVTPLYALVNGAAKTIDMTMYALEDTTFTNDLLAACKRNVTVRVILDQNLEKSGNTSAYNSLNAQANCSAVWANKAFQATHEKCFIIDGTTVSIMSLNLQTQYYSTTRDYALVENDPADIAAIQATFNADYLAGTPSSGVAGASDFTYAPTAGDDLIWSPTTAQTAMLGLINNAKATLLLENEEMGATNIVSALTTACGRGVTVRIAMEYNTSYTANFTLLKNAGCKVSTYNNPNGFYIHAKAVVADFGLSTQMVYMGSINYSTASMTENRELGLYITDTGIVTTLNNTMTSDFNGGTAY